MGLFDYEDDNGFEFTGYDNDTDISMYKKDWAESEDEQQEREEREEREYILYQWRSLEGKYGKEAVQRLKNCYKGFDKDNLLLDVVTLLLFKQHIPSAPAFRHDIEEDKIIQMFQNGNHISEIAAACGCHRDTVRKRLVKCGVYKKRNNAT